MASGDLVQDPISNLIDVGSQKVGKGMAYEFAFPLKNNDPGDTLWERGRSYQLAVLVGPTQEFQGINEETWMSDQILIRIGSPSTASIYHPPLQAGMKGGSKQGSHGH